MRRVVVTGLGAITPLGAGLRRTWSRLLAGESGLVSTSGLSPQSQWAEIPSRVAGLVPRGSATEGKWQASDWLARGDERTMAKFSQYAVAAAGEALRDANWTPTTREQQEMTGVCLGSGIGSLEDLVDTSAAYTASVRTPILPLSQLDC